MRLIAALVIALLFLPGAGSMIPSAAAQTNPVGSLFGHICSEGSYFYDEDPAQCHGGPLPNASVHISNEGIAAGVGSVDEEATTDAEGWYQIDNIPEGEYQVVVERAGFAALEEQITIGEHTEYTRNLEGKEVRFHGTVQDPKGRPVASVSLYLEGVRGAKVSTDEDGAFEHEVPAGYYFIQVEAGGYQYQNLHKLVDGTKAHKFTLEKVEGQSAHISGTVLDQNDNPVAGATVEVYSNRYYNEPWVAYAEESSGQSGDVEEPQGAMLSPDYYGGGRNSTTTDEDGAYSMRVHPGWVSIQVHKEGYTQYSAGFEVGKESETSHDATIKKLPDKNAHIEGTILDQDGEPVPFLSMDLQNPEYGVWACGSDGREEYRQDCDIKIRSDGTLEGNVTPGYTILNLYHQHWRSCKETTNSDGSYSRECGPEYLRHVQSLDLEPNSTTTLDIVLRQRPGPDATISGYIVDEATNTAIPGASISFYSDESRSNGHAQTDGDGSYKVGLRGGMHHVTVWADGYYRWEGMVQIDSGSDKPFDVFLKEGHDQCCYGYPEPVPYAVDEVAEDGASPAYAGGADTSGGRETSTVEVAVGEASQQAEYEDLGGGLGPYDSEKRQQVLEEDSPAAIPPVGILWLMVAALGAAAAWRRRS